MVSRSKVISFLIKSVIVYLALVAALYLAQRKMIFYPDRERPNPADYRVSESAMRQTETEDGLTLEGWYWPPVRADLPVIVWFHGNAGHYAHRTLMIVPYLEQGYGVLLAEYRGYANNPGSPSEEGFYKDARGWMDFLSREGIGPHQVVLYGESIGSGVAVQMALEHPEARGLVLQAPYTSLPDIARKTYFFIPVDLLMKDKFENLKKIPQIKIPLLVMNGTDDKVVPPAHGKKLYEAANEPKKIITLEDYGHNDLPIEDIAEAVMSFLSENVRH